MKAPGAFLPVPSRFAWSGPAIRKASARLRSCRYISRIYHLGLLFFYPFPSVPLISIPVFGLKGVSQGVREVLARSFSLSHWSISTNLFDTCSICDR